MLGNVNVLPQYNENILLLLSAVYYRNYALLRSCVVVAGQVSSISILALCLNISSRYQKQELRNTVQLGTLDKCQGWHQEQWWIYVYGHHQYSIYSSASIDQTSSMSIVHTNPCLQCPLSI